MLKSLGLWKSSLSFKGTPINQVSLFNTIDTRCSMSSEGYQGSVDNDPSTEQTTVVLAPEFLHSSTRDEQLVHKSYEQSFDKSNSVDTDDLLEIMPLSWVNRCTSRSIKIIVFVIGFQSQETLQPSCVFLRTINRFEFSSQRRCLYVYVSMRFHKYICGRFWILGVRRKYWIIVFYRIRFARKYLFNRLFLWLLQSQSDGGVSQYFEENKVPVPFLIMLTLQFALITIDRLLYLRKYILGKILFQFVLIIGSHMWMFFILPGVTER